MLQARIVSARVCRKDDTATIEGHGVTSDLTKNAVSAPLSRWKFTALECNSTGRVSFRGSDTGPCVR